MLKKMGPKRAGTCAGVPSAYNTHVMSPTCVYRLWKLHFSTPGTRLSTMIRQLHVVHV